MMGSRFGSPTERFGSGTEQEFREAFGSYRARSRPRLGFFFKDENIGTGNLAVSDIEQLLLVRRFRDEISPSGLYYGFSTDSDLTNHITRFVAAIVDDLSVDEVKTNMQYTLESGSTIPTPSIGRHFSTDVLNRLESDIGGPESSYGLQDIWVDPELSETKDEEGAASPRATVTFSDLLRWLGDGTSIVLTGTDTSGKTCVAKMAFVRLFEAGFFPVLISGERIPAATDLARLEQRMRVAFAEQYENVDWQRADVANRIVLIVDDADQVRLPIHRLSRLLSEIRLSFPRSLLTASDSFVFQFLEAPEHAAVLSEFRRLKIADIGNRTRTSLIEKWCSLGSEHLQPDALQQLIHEKRKIVNRVLSSNLVPRTPFIVLVLLRAIEIGESRELQRTGYVRYYKFGAYIPA